MYEETKLVLRPEVQNLIHEVYVNPVQVSLETVDHLVGDAELEKVVNLCHGRVVVTDSGALERRLRMKAPDIL